jgi:predicted nucleotidyltransferase
MANIDRDNVIRILGSNKDGLIQNYGLLKLGVFGSVARNEAGEGSDIDIVVETKVPDLLRMVNLKEDLEELLHSKVDLVRYRFRMNALLKKRIDKEAHYV